MASPALQPIVQLFTRFRRLIEIRRACRNSQKWPIYDRFYDADERRLAIAEEDGGRKGKERKEERLPNSIEPDLPQETEERPDR